MTGRRSAVPRDVWCYYGQPPGSIVVHTLGALIDSRARRIAAPPVGVLTALEAARAADCEVLTSSKR
ncbi:hypothetical protein [Streptomyces yanii]|uniref:Uncharacterized protein n=1 Tax=Streptomyces yanii TaxID=78510 RepID=A0ABV5R5N6_9ACTN